MAYAELAGLPPITGLYTSILCLVGYAVFGPSRILVLGPDSSLGPMIAATILPLLGAHGDPQRAVALASVLALLVGAIMVLGGVARLGFVADLLSKPTMIGYMNGLALTILVGQLPEAVRLLGRRRRLHRGAEGVRARASPTARRWRRARGRRRSGSSAILVLQRVLPKVPGVLVAVVLSIVAASVFDLAEHGVKLVGTLPQGFPPLTLPDVGLSDLPLLLGGAVGIALVSLADTIATASAFAERTGQEVDGSQEMIGIGAANIAAGLFQGFPVSTSGSRTAVAEQAGAKTQVTGLVGAVAITLMLVLVPGLLRNLPQPTLAAVVIAASLSLADIPGTIRLWRQRRSEFVLSIAAFLGVVLLGVLPGIAIAVAVSVADVFRRSWWPYQAVLGRVAGRARLPRPAQLPRRGAAAGARHLPLRRAAVLRERADVPRADPRARRRRAAADVDRRRRRADHRRRHDRGGHARGPRRGDQRAGRLARLRRDEGPGPAEDRALRAHAHDRPGPLLPDARRRDRRVPARDGRELGPSVTP